MGILKRSFIALAVTGIGVAALPAAGAGAGSNSMTVAVYGDSPYGTTPTDTAELVASPAFIDSINNDADVSLVAHVGDIHSGKQFCTEAYDRSVASLWTRFADPVVYTPGDNEWADCHKKGEGGGVYNATTGQIDYVLDPATALPVDYASGDPAANLSLIRSIFFAKPGQTLGSGSQKVVSQATAYSRSFPTDRKFVENVMWQRKDVVFVTVNIPGGSNNDNDVWYGAPAQSAAQAQDVAERTAADVRWIQAAFQTAVTEHAAGVVIMSQADMWDLDGKTAAHLTEYEPFVKAIADGTSAFGKPVLLFEGDSHSYRSDNPLSASAPCVTEVAGVEVACPSSEYINHPSYDVANFHRVIVHGSTFPLEWLKLTINSDKHAANSSNAFGPFSWQRMPQP